MKGYTVRIPFTGYVEIHVEAESEDLAIKKAYDLADIGEHLCEHELHRKVCEGNVCRAVLNEVEVYED